MNTTHDCKRQLVIALVIASPCSWHLQLPAQYTQANQAPHAQYTNTNVLPMRLQQSPRPLHCQLQHKCVAHAPATKPKISHCRRLHPAHPGAHRKLVLAYRTENANRIKRKEKRKNDVIHILINPSEKAKCGHGAMLTTVPPGAAAGSGLGSARRLDGGGPAAGPPGAPRGCGITAVRNRTSSSTRPSHRRARAFARAVARAGF